MYVPKLSQNVRPETHLLTDNYLEIVDRNAYFVLHDIFNLGHHFICLVKILLTLTTYKDMNLSLTQQRFTAKSLASGMTAYILL